MPLSLGRAARRSHVLGHRIVMSEGSVERAVAEHYGNAGLLSAIDAELRSRGLDPNQIEPRDLELVDHFHTAGARATIDLADLAGLTPRMKTIDVGGGTGGPARLLASTYACDVT